MAATREQQEAARISNLWFDCSSTVTLRVSIHSESVEVCRAGCALSAFCEVYLPLWLAVRAKALTISAIRSDAGMMSASLAIFISRRAVWPSRSGALMLGAMSSMLEVHYVFAAQLASSEAERDGLFL